MPASPLLVERHRSEQARRPAARSAAADGCATTSSTCARSSCRPHAQLAGERRRRKQSQAHGPLWDAGHNDGRLDRVAEGDAVQVGRTPVSFSSSITTAA
jgi:hypothetical protein